MNHHYAEQKQKPAKTSCKARGESKRRKARKAPKITRDQIEREALANATQGQSVANYDAIFEGFEAMGIDADDIRPRENVFTFNAWKALGRVVRRGQHGVTVVTFIVSKKTDPETGEETESKHARRTTVFHVSQTDPLTPQH